LKKETFVEVTKEVGGDPRVSIRNGKASVQRCRRTLTKKTAKIMDVSVERTMPVKG
jgi:hypothetical protein